MIRVSISGYRNGVDCPISSDPNDIKILVSGHAVYSNPVTAFFYSAFARKEKNIVCAAVSALSLNFLKSIILIAGLNPDYEQRNGYLSLLIKVGKTDPEMLKIFNTLLKSFILGISDLQKNYPGLIQTEIIN